MKRFKFLSETEFKNQITEGRWKYYVAVFVAVLLFGGNVALSAAVWAQRTNSHEIIEPNGGFCERTEFVNGRLPANYLRRMVSDVVMKELHYSYPGARSQYAELVAMFDPSVLTVMKSKYSRRADVVEKGEYVSSFFIDKDGITVRRPTEIEVRGTRILEGHGVERKQTSEKVVVTIAPTTPFRVMDIRMEEQK